MVDLARHLHFWNIAVMAVTMSGSGTAAGELPKSSDTVLTSETPDQALFDVAVGATYTSDFVDRGVTNSDSGPAFQGYIEPALGPAYLNIWSSNVDFGDGFRGQEVDVTAGIRSDNYYQYNEKSNPLAYEFGYSHYFYHPKFISPSYGEIFTKFKYRLKNKILPLTLTSEAYFSPDYNDSGKAGTYIASGIELKMTDNFDFSSIVGYQFSDDPNSFPYMTWNAGVTYVGRNKLEGWKFDVRYWDTNLSSDECVMNSGFADGCNARVLATLSIETSLLALKGQ